jgi:hypothetical protein
MAFGAIRCSAALRIALQEAQVLREPLACRYILRSLPVGRACLPARARRQQLLPPRPENEIANTQKLVQSTPTRPLELPTSRRIRCADCDSL